MTISNDYENKLNKMNKASQNVSLGTVLKQLDNIANSASPIDALQFNINYSGSHTEGLLHWNSDDGVLEMDMPGGNVAQQIGTEILVKVVNKTGYLIPNGSVVYGTGSQGNRLTIAPAISNNNSIANTVIGMATEDIENNKFGYVTLYGLVRGIPTSDFIEGQIVYLSSTNSGCLVSTPPLSPNTVVGIGIVTVSHAVEGTIAVSPRILSTSASRIILVNNKNYFDSTNIEDALNELMSGSVVFDGVNISGSSSNHGLVVNQYGSGSSATFGNDDGKLTITNYGELRLSGSATVWDDLKSPATSISPQGSLSPPIFDIDNVGFNFSGSAQNILSIVNQMPYKWLEESDISPHIHILNTNIDSGNMLWRMDYNWTNVNGIDSGSWIRIESLVAASGSTNFHQLIELPTISGSGKFVDSTISLKLSRVGDDVSDTHTGNSLFKEFDIHYQMDSLGSNKEYIKY